MTKIFTKCNPFKTKPLESSRRNEITGSNFISNQMVANPQHQTYLNQHYPQNVSVCNNQHQGMPSGIQCIHNGQYQQANQLAQQTVPYYPLTSRSSAVDFRPVEHSSAIPMNNQNQIFPPQLASTPFHNHHQLNTIQPMSYADNSLYSSQFTDNSVTIGQLQAQQHLQQHQNHIHQQAYQPPQQIQQPQQPPQQQLYLNHQPTVGNLGGYQQPDGAQYRPQVGELKNQQPRLDYRLDRPQSQPQQQQRHQSSQEAHVRTSRDEDLSIDVSCMMYEKSRENLNKMAKVLKYDIEKLSQEIEVIHKDPPKNGVDVVASL